MNIPGFTADLSFYEASQQYHLNGAFNEFTLDAKMVNPQLIAVKYWKCPTSCAAHCNKAWPVVPTQNSQRFACVKACRKKCRGH